MAASRVCIKSFKLNSKKDTAPKQHLSAGPMQSSGHESFGPWLLMGEGPRDKVHHLLISLRPAEMGQGRVIPRAAMRTRHGCPQGWGAPGRSPFCAGKKLKAPGQKGAGRPGAWASELPTPAQVLPLTRVCLSVGEERASTLSFGQILSIRSCSIWRGMGVRVGGVWETN